MFGTFSALNQFFIKRFFLYSMITNTGFLLAGLSVNTFDGFFGYLVFLIIYIFTLFGIFSVLNSFREHSTQVFFNTFNIFEKISFHYPYRVFILSFLLFSLGGLPPLAGFFAKFFILSALISAKSFILSFFVIFASLLSLFYYLRIIKMMLFDKITSNMRIPFLQQPSVSLAVIQVLSLFFVFGLCIAGNTFFLALLRFITLFYLN